MLASCASLQALPAGAAASLSDDCDAQLLQAAFTALNLRDAAVIGELPGRGVSLRAALLPRLEHSRRYRRVDCSASPARRAPADRCPVSARVDSLVTLGVSPYCSCVSCTLSLSTSAVTLSLKLLPPTMGASRFSALRIVSSR